MASPTIRDIAKRCGVSIATVSLVLNNKDSRISAKTRSKVLEIAELMNYTPNQSAVRLRTKKSKMLGVIVSNLSNPHIAKVFMGIDRVARQHGYILNCCTSEKDGSLSAARANELVASGVEGVILSIPSMNEDGEAWQKVLHVLVDSGLPIVSRDNNSIYKKKVGSNFNINYEAGAYMATRHLIDLGHRKIGCVTGTEAMGVTTSRLNGYYRALHEGGITKNEALIFKGDYEVESGSLALPYLLGKGVTAVFTFNDNMAYGLYRSARNFGILIPEDLSVVGFDNADLDDILEVPLTSVDIEADELGPQMANEMIRLINTEARDYRNVIFEPNLMVRASTAALGRIIG